MQTEIARCVKKFVCSGTSMTTSGVRPTLPGRDYHAPAVFELERERIFFREWIYVARSDEAPEPGDFVTIDVAGESLLLVRGEDGELRGFYNVCRHRGSRLCDPETHGHAKGAIKCPYHAWSYAYDGRLIGTPLVGKDELDRSSFGLWPVTVEVWQGYVFVNLGEPRSSLRESLELQTDKPLQYERWGMDELRTGHRTVTEVAANWKILVENYNECLHCPTVHPELFKVAPTFGKGLVYEEGRDDWGVSIVGGGVGYTATGTTKIPVMPGLDEQTASSMYGATIFPNMFIDLTGTVVIATASAAPQRAAHDGGDRLSLPPGGRRRPRVRPDRGGRVLRAGRPSGLRRLRARSARRSVARIRPRRVRGEGCAAVRVQPDVPCGARPRVVAVRPG